MEALLEADVALLRSQLDALPIWDPELHTRLRRVRDSCGFVWICWVGWGFTVAPEGGALECSGTVSGESLALLTGEARVEPPRAARCGRSGAVRVGLEVGPEPVFHFGLGVSEEVLIGGVWVYRFTSAATAAAQLCHHPTLAATASQLRAAVVCRRAGNRTAECWRRRSFGVREVYLAAAWRATSSTPAPPTNTPLPLAAAARGEKRLRQLALEVMVAEVRRPEAGDEGLGPGPSGTQWCEFRDQALRNGSTAAPAGPRFACRLADLACLDEDGKEDSAVEEVVGVVSPVGGRREGRYALHPVVLAPLGTPIPEAVQAGPDAVDGEEESEDQPEMSEKALLESDARTAVGVDVTAALAAAKRLLKRDLSEAGSSVVEGPMGLTVSPSDCGAVHGPLLFSVTFLVVLNPPPPPPPNANQLGLLHLARGIDAKAFVHSGDQVPIRLAVLPDYSMSVEAA
ncbi:unnamed protein product [Durusdinium trenchii]|uniref:Uncharacterized protein n=1 Tax=Durusdinium trenchii TaxID=1381693 RepID=A0ABP0M4D8_9DINO